MMRIRSFIFDILQIIVTLITMLSIIVMLVLPWQMSMKAIVGQKLLKTIVDLPPRVPIIEILLFNTMVRKLVEKGEDNKLHAAIRIGAEDGMQLFNDSLYEFIQMEFISRAAAFEVSPNVEELKMRLKGIDVKGAAIL